MFPALAALVFAAVAAAAPPAPSGPTPPFPGSAPVPPEADRLLARGIFAELIAIDSTHAKGSTAAAEAVRRRLLAGGFAPGDVTFVAPPDKPHKGNVVVRLRGKGKEPPVLVLGHLDVVEARPEDWSFDPFKLTEKDGWLYGRGTVDMKNGDAALLAALLRLRREKFVPDRDLIAAFTADEEAGGDANGPEYLLKHHRDLVDAGLVINLDGGGGALKNGRPLFFEIGTSEKTYVTYTFETTSPGGHGSLPGPDNAIYRLAAALGRVEAFKFPVVTTATTRASFAAFADLDPGPDSADMRAVAQEPPDAAAAERLSRTVRFNAQLRTTCVATQISGGHAPGALPQRARATVQCRMMPGDSAERVQAALSRVVDDPKVAITLDAPPIVSPESAPTPKILATVGKVVHSMWPGTPLVPTMATGYSDDRQTRNAGIPSYDVGGTWADVDENRAHGRDERIGARAFDESVEYTYRLMKAVGAAGSGP
jgi:acetylornithine deacetylase/succinyl-diaminopimelate desuccinylase-like protein